jgi:hypothetical protein
VRYQFVVYTREAPAAGAAAAAGAKVRQVDMAGAPPVLPPAVASQHDEHQVGAGKAQLNSWNICRLHYMNALCCQSEEFVPSCVLGI